MRQANTNLFANDTIAGRICPDSRLNLESPSLFKPLRNNSALTCYWVMSGLNLTPLPQQENDGNYSIVFKNQWQIHLQPSPQQDHMTDHPH